MKRVRGFAGVLGMFLVAWVISLQAADVPLGPRDVVKITVYDQPDLSVDTKLNEAGKVSYPFLGEVSIGGLTPSAASKKLAGLLKNGGFVRDPQVSITVVQSYSQMVSVLGEVKNPGLYPVDGKLTVTDVLAMAGGVTTEGGDTATLVRNENGKTTKRVLDIAGIARMGSMTQNDVLIADDIIYVDRFPKVYIYGEVNNPGAYRLERGMTVLQVLSVGGGLSPRGTKRGIRMKRRDNSGNAAETVVTLDDLVQADDILYVRESLF